MTTGNKIAIHSKLLAAQNPDKKKRSIRTTQPVMIYLDHDLNAQWEEFAHKNRTSKSQVAREAIQARVNTKGDLFTSGYNTALEDVSKAIAQIEAFKMTFPSGSTFSMYADQALATLHRENSSE